VSTKSGPALANLEFRFLRALMNFGKGQYENSKGEPLITVNPVSRLSETKAWHRIKRRQTIISKTDLPRWFEAVGELKNTDFCDYLTLLFLTGLRRSEGFKLQWSDIDMKSKTFIIQDTKNHNPLSLPMGDLLFKMFEQRKKFSKSEWIFPGSGRMGHMVEPKGALKEIQKKTGIRFSFHDLRRLFITTAESLDISIYAVKALVNHSLNGDVTGGYIVIDPERLREPMQRIEAHLLKLCQVEEPENPSQK
jgi:integrase